MARYFITGAAGFIASKVAELLLADGHAVVGIDSLNDAYDVRLKQWRLKQTMQHPNFAFHHGDICDIAQIEHAFGDGEFAAVINLAARAGVRQSVDNPTVYFETNVIGTLNLLELCKRYNVSKFVLASTSSLYGKSKAMPYSESHPTDLPLSPYAASKKGAEVLCYTYHYLNQIDTSILRFFTVYGPAGRPEMSLFRFAQWIAEGRPVIVTGDGTQSRDFTYVDDIARGVVAACRPVGYEIINLGSDAPFVLIDTIRTLEGLLGKKAHLEFTPTHPADVPATWADITKARTLLDWEPTTSVNEGLAKMVEWYLSNRSWAREIVTE